MWYSGSIVQAIKESKESSRIFLVYISGDDELSQKMDQFWEDDAVTKISKNSCVALKLKHDSEEIKQFSAIYPVLCIPSAYFIGNDGKIIEALTAQSSSKELAERVKSVAQVFEQKFGSESENDAGASASYVGTSTSVEENKNEGKKANELSEEDMSKKVNELQNKIKKKRVEKSQQEKELEKQKELERRELGKNLQSFKEEQRQARLRRDIEERKRDKIQEQEARDRIKRQIEEDKLERTKHFQNEKKERDELQAKQLQGRAVDEENEQKMKEENKNAQSRLQFRLPDGSAFTHNFESMNTLQFVTDFIVEQNIQPFGKNASAFRLLQSFPRKAFGESDLGSTLRELGLTPNASLLILPCAVQRSADNSLVAKIGAMLIFVLMLLPRFLSYIWESIFSSPADVEQRSSESMAPDSQYSDGKSSSVRRRTGASKTISKKDNMTRLSDVKRDSDEDDATWNGNSTQQM